MRKRYSDTVKQFDYGTAVWKRKRLHILALDRYMDRYAARFGKRTEATIVHHIYPADKFPEYALCDWNLISVSMASHNKLENRNTGELTEEGMALMERTVPGVDWRKKPWRTS